MQILVDTHILIWHLEGNPQLSLEWSELLTNPANEKYFSIASLWEIAIKTNIEKLTINYPLTKFIPVDFRTLPIEITHLSVYQQLPLHHRDPFDRILVAQAQVEDLFLMTHDPNVKLYEVKLIR